jgi:Pyridoxamine 5'-phosphate oxidase
MRWGELEVGAAEVAGPGRERLEAAGVALLGTLRRDGFPRISPIEPYLAAGNLLLGAMARSWKARDLRRDPRCTLHSVISRPNAGEVELKLYGRAVEVTDAVVRNAAGRAWWVSRPAEQAYVVSLDVESAALVEWDLGRGEMTVTRWSAEAGLTRATRAYP